jgi:hypothetical protein
MAVGIGVRCSNTRTFFTFINIPQAPFQVTYLLTTTRANIRGLATLKPSLVLYRSRVAIWMVPEFRHVDLVERFCLLLCTAERALKS